MIAFITATILYVALVAIGFSFIPKQIVRKDSVISFLISPVLGLSILVSFVFFYSRLGFATKDLKYLVLIFLVLVSIYATIKARRHVNDSALYFKLSVVPLGTVLSSWPIFKYGFNWVSFFNDDMTNYVLGATRFFNFGFNTEPMNSFYEGKDYSQAYYFLYSANGIRSGSELYLSVVSLISNGDPMTIFMTGILVIQMILFSTTLLLTRLFEKPPRNFTRIVFLFCVFSPLFSLGFLYQLAGQLGGVSIGIGIVATVVLLLDGKYNKLTIHLFSILSVLFAAQCIWYPEFLPFLTPAFAYLLLWVKRNKSHIPWTKTLVSLLPVPLILNAYILDALKYGFAQVSRTTSASKGSDSLMELFPFYLKPHGLNALLGFQPSNRFALEPWESVITISSILILASIVYFIYRRRLYMNLIVMTFLFMFLILLFLIGTKNGFGTFKLAMFIQPFLIVSGVLAFFPHQLKKNKLPNFLSKSMRVSFFFIFFVFLALNARTLQYYTLASTGESDRGFSEVYQGSKENVHEEVKALLMKTDIDESPLISTSFNLGLLKAEAIATRGNALFFASHDVFENIRLGSELKDFPSGYLEQSISTPWGINQFLQPKAYLLKDTSLKYLISNDQSSAINRMSMPKFSGSRRYQIQGNPSNMLIFVSSSQGQSYSNFGTSVSSSSIFQPELNPMQPKAFMQGIGKNLLFEIVNPSDKPVLVFSGTNTVIPQYEREFLPTYVYSNGLSRLPLVGRGSMRVQVPLTNMIRINGRSYFQVHVDSNLSKFPSTNSLVSGLYGRNIQFDNRRLSMFLTDISVVDQGKLANISAPMSISRFPKDLGDSRLIYSGVYEDGWISANSYFYLSDKTSSSITIEGSIPMLDGDSSFETMLTLSIDDKQLMTKKLGVGEFSLSMPWISDPKLIAKKRVSIEFSKERKLPSPDGRPIAAQISFVGFK